jgi:Sap, sulfolipid-1-addressing protein
MSLELQLLVIALDAALYPTLLAAVVILLAQPRARRLLAAYLAAGLTVSIAAGCLIVYGLQQSGVVHGSSSAPNVTADLAVGGLMVLLAVAVAVRADVRFAERRRKRRPQERTEPDPGAKEPWSQRILARGSVPIVVVAALAINLPGAAYLIALKDIAAADLAAARAVGLIVAFNAIMFLLAEVPLAGLVFAPDRTGALVARLNAWLSRNSRTIAIVLCAGLGAFLITRGILNASG